MNEDVKKMLLELGESDYGDTLREYLDERLEAMEGNLDSVENWEDVLGRRKAKKIIKEIFYFLKPKRIEPKEKNQYV